MSKKTDWLATAQASQSKDFRAKNPHLFCACKSISGICAIHDAKEQTKSTSPPKKAGKRRKEMNKTEARFAALLDARVARGEIISWAYEEITLRWPDGMRYTPDFVLIVRDPSFPVTYTVLVEVKGAHSWAKDIVKFRSARDKWGGRFRFQFCQEVNGQWKETR